MAEEFVFPSVGQLLKSEGVWLRKSRSQHFLKDQNVCREIAHLFAAEPGVVALEIGTGLGNLTWELSRVCRHVVTVELDQTFAEWHGHLGSKAGNVSFVEGDFLKLDLDGALSPFAGAPLVAGGNLPYQITAPILFRLASCGIPWRRIVVMVQEEVADRIAAGIGTRRASAITYKLGLQYSSRVALRVGAGQFLPPPKVQSAVLVLEPLPRPLVTNEAEKARAFRVIEAAFQHRRRTLANALVLGGACGSRGEAEEALRGVGIDPIRRPETLSGEEVVALAGCLGDRAGAGDEDGHKGPKERKDTELE